MEVHQAGIRLPRRDRPPHPGVVERLRTPKPAGHSLLGADVIAGKYVQASEPPQHHVLGRPPTHAAQLEQTLPGDGIVFHGDGLQIQFPPHNRVGQLEQSADLLMAEPDRPVSLWREPRDVAFRREGVVGAVRRLDARAGDRREAVEQFEANLQ